jgi:hypothetical protein
MPRGFKARRNWADETPAEPDVETGNGPAFPELTPSGTVPEVDTPDQEMPGMWERADFEGGQESDTVEPEGAHAAATQVELAEEMEPVTEAEERAVGPLVPMEVVQDVEPAVPDANIAPFGHQYNWDTATWTAPRGSGTKPCGCNRLVGHGCELTTKSRFATGHDARFKGILQKAFRKGEKLEVDFGPEDNAFIENSEGVAEKLEGRYLMEADQIARLLAPKLLPHVTHDTRAAKLQKADAEAGTVVPQTAVEGKPDEELTDADVEAQTDDAPRDAEFVEA